jgi:hypothetical protein
MYRRNNIKASLITLIIYCALAIGPTLYWANNFSRFTRYKGDEFFYLLEYLLGLTVLYYIIQLICLREMKWLKALVVPLVIVISSVLVVFLLLFITPLVATPSETIYIYGIVYSLTNVLLSASTILKVAKRQKNTS